MLSAHLLLVLASAPLRPNLVPATLRLMLPPALVLHADEPVRPKKTFHDGRLLAGVLGGIYTASVLAPRIAVGCPNNHPLRSRGAVGAFATAGISIAIGTGLGLLAAHEVPGGYPLLIAFDVAGPVGSTVYSLTVC
jgi:hypothetical protein